MARTPLFRELRRMIARAAAEIGQERSAQVGPSREITRRDVIRGMGAGAAMLAAGPLVRRLGAKPHQPRIAIVGGGIAGLNCALTLMDAGLASTIYEAGTRTGGRMHSDRQTWQEGHVSEWGGEFIDTGHLTIQGLAARFGFTLDDVHAAELHGATETYFFDGNYYPYAQANKDFKHLARTLDDQNKKAPFPTQWNWYTPLGWKLDHMSIREWIETYVPGGFASNLGQLLDVAYDIEFGAATTVQSALNLVSLLPGPTHNLDLFGFSDETYHLKGGNDQIPAAIAAALPAGTIKLDHRMMRIAKRKDRTLEVEFSTPGGNTIVVADHVVLALPFSVLRRLDYTKAGFDNRKTTAIEQLGYGTNTKLMLEFDRRYWLDANKPWGVSTGTTYGDTGFQTAWDTTRAQPGTTGVLTNYTGSNGIAMVPQDRDEETTATSVRVTQYASDFLGQIEPVYTGISGHFHGVAALSAKLYDPNARGSYSYWKVGQNTLFGGYEAVRQGNIHFAGEHTSTDFQGYMEGGAEQGARAAQELIDDVGP